MHLKSMLTAILVTAVLPAAAQFAKPEDAYKYRASVMTLQGAHSFSSGRFTGSVSAASNSYTWIQNADASIGSTGTIGTSTLVIAWAGANQLTLP